MKKIGKLLKQNAIIVVGVVIGCIISAGVGAATVPASSISYSNSSSGISSTNVQGAVDSIYYNTRILKGLQAVTTCSISLRSSATSSAVSSYITSCKNNLSGSSASFAAAATKMFGSLETYCYMNWIKGNVSSGLSACCTSTCNVMNADSTCISYCKDIDSIVKATM